MNVLDGKLLSLLLATNVSQNAALVLSAVLRAFGY